MPAAIVALPLLAGALTGLVISDYTATALSIYSASGAVLALLSAAGAFSVESSLEAVIAIATGCLLAGLSLGVTSAFLAYHPPLLQWFESRPSRDPSEPILIDGVLREDASRLDRRRREANQHGLGGRRSRVRRLPSSWMCEPSASTPRTDGYRRPSRAASASPSAARSGPHGSCSGGRAAECGFRHCSEHHRLTWIREFATIDVRSRGGALSWSAT